MLAGEHRVAAFFHARIRALVGRAARASRHRQVLRVVEVEAFRFEMEAKSTLGVAGEEVAKSSFFHRATVRRQSPPGRTLLGRCRGRIGAQLESNLALATATGDET